MVWLGPSPFERERQCAELLFQPGLTAEDQRWLRDQFEMAGLPAPDHDISWIRMEKIRG
jgi:hypothetical protein